MDAKRQAGEGGSPLPEVGLCSACEHAVTQTSAKGARFWRCRRADTEPDFLRYPPLPVERCAGFEAVGAAETPQKTGRGPSPAQRDRG